MCKTRSKKYCFCIYFSVNNLIPELPNTLKPITLFVLHLKSAQKGILDAKPIQTKPFNKTSFSLESTFKEFYAPIIGIPFVAS